MMFRFKALLFGIISAMLLTNGSMAFAEEAKESTNGQISSPVESSNEILGYYELDGGKTTVPVKEEEGVVERMQSGTTLEYILTRYPMSAEAEAKLVHCEPEVPFMVDGVLYQPEQIHLFDGQRLGFTIGEGGLLYAFTNYETLMDFSEKQVVSGVRDTGSEYSIFYEYTNYTWQSYRLLVLPNVTFHSLYMDDMISSLKISTSATCGCTLFEDENLQGDYLNIPSGADRSNLGYYGWDNRASSLVVWP